MLRRVRDWRRVGWSIVVIALLAVIVATLVFARSLEAESLNRMVAVGAFLAAVGGLALTVALKLWAPRSAAARTPTELADALMRQVLDREGRVLNNLLSTGHDPGRAALLVFYDAEGSRGDLPGVAEFYRAHTAGRLVVLGAPGAGKTVLLLRLICDLAKARDALEEPKRSRTPVPLRFDLASWDTALELEDWLAGTMAARFTNLTREQALALLEQRLVLPVLDGLDEMDNAANQPLRAQEAVKHLNRYLSGTDLKQVVLACREDEYRRLGIQVAEAGTARIVPLLPAEVDRFVREELGRDLDPAPLREWEDSIPETLFDGFWEAVSTPWVLTLLVVYLRDGGRMESLVAPQPADGPAASYRDQVLSTLLARYVPARVRAAGSYSAVGVQRWLGSLARNLGNGVDIRLEDVWRIGGNLRVRLLHTLSATPILACCIAVAVLSVNHWEVGYLVWRIRSSFENFSAVPVRWIVGGACFAFLAVLAGWTVVKDATTEHLVAVNRPMTLTNLRTTKGRKRLASRLAWGLAPGLAVGLAMWLAWGIVGGARDGARGWVRGWVRDGAPEC